MVRFLCRLHGPATSSTACTRKITPDSFASAGHLTTPAMLCDCLRTKTQLVPLARLEFQKGPINHRRAAYASVAMSPVSAKLVLAGAGDSRALASGHS